MVRWTAENDKLLEQMFDQDLNDHVIAAYFRAGVYAIAKRRSQLGLVKFKKGSYTRATKADKSPDIELSYTITYTKDGQQHYCNLGSMDLGKLEKCVQQLIYAQKVKEVVVLKPVSRFVMNAIKEIKL